MRTTLFLLGILTAPLACLSACGGGDSDDSDTDASSSGAAGTDAAAGSGGSSADGGGSGGSASENGGSGGGDGAAGGAGGAPDTEALCEGACTSRAEADCEGFDYEQCMTECRSDASYYAWYLSCYDQFRAAKECEAEAEFTCPDLADPEECADPQSNLDACG